MDTQINQGQPAQAATIKPVNMAGYYKNRFQADVENFRDSGRLKSGYANLDAITGLYPGLYVLGAVPSLGKTTFSHQMAEQMAESGCHVLFFSLEQSTLELASKSIARAIARDNAEDGLSSLQVRKAGLTDPRIASAVERCMAYSGRMTVIECSFRATISDIACMVQSYIREHKTTPAVFIDYLQVIQPAPESRMTAKDAVDFHMKRLKEIQSDCQATMVVISSLNRQNYMSAVDFESFKESGGIEYTADVIWGLQLQCLNDDLFSKPNRINEKRKLIREAKREAPRKIELVCLKNRFGVSSYSCLFDYHARFDLFVPDTPGQTPAPGCSRDTDGFMMLPKDLEKELPW